MTFSLPHSVKFSGMVQRSLCLLCFFGIFVMVVGLHKPWICVTISTMVLHPLKLPGCRNGSGKFKACILRNFSRRLKLTTFPITIATQDRLERQKMSASGFRAGVGAVAPQGWAAGLGFLGFQSGSSMGGGLGLGLHLRAGLARASPCPGSASCGKSSVLQLRHILSSPRLFLEAMCVCAPG